MVSASLQAGVIQRALSAAEVRAARIGVPVDGFVTILPCV
jgi:hypothetical protein